MLTKIPQYLLGVGSDYMDGSEAVAFLLEFYLCPAQFVFVPWALDFNEYGLAASDESAHSTPPPASACAIDNDPAERLQQFDYLSLDLGFCFHFYTSQ
jgi:hypothetical protein